MRKFALILIAGLALALAASAAALITYQSKASGPTGWHAYKPALPSASLFKSDPAVKKAQAAVTRAQTATEKVSAQRLVNKIIANRQQRAAEAMARTRAADPVSCETLGHNYGSLGNGQIAVRWNYDGSIDVDTGNTNLPPEVDPRLVYTGGVVGYYAPIEKFGYFLGALPGVTKYVKTGYCTEQYEWVSTGEVCETDPDTGEEYCYDDGYYQLTDSHQYTFRHEWDGKAESLIPEGHELPNVDGFVATTSAYVVLSLKKK